MQPASKRDSMNQDLTIQGQIAQSTQTNLQQLTKQETPSTAMIAADIPESFMQPKGQKSLSMNPNAKSLQVVEISIDPKVATAAESAGSGGIIVFSPKKKQTTQQH